jgi:hypothetical protein
MPASRSALTLPLVIPKPCTVYPWLSANSRIAPTVVVFAVPANPSIVAIPLSELKCKLCGGDLLGRKALRFSPALDLFSTRDWLCLCFEPGAHERYILAHRERFN